MSLEIGDPVEWGYGNTGVIRQFSEWPEGLFALVEPDDPHILTRWIMAKELHLVP